MHTTPIRDTLRRFIDFARLPKKTFTRSSVITEAHTSVLAHWGMYAQWDGRWEEAEGLYKRALLLSDSLLARPLGHSGRFARRQLASLYSETFRYDEADPLVLEVLGSLEETGRDTTLEWAQTLFTLARVYQKQDRNADAERQDHLERLLLLL